MRLIDSLTIYHRANPRRIGIYHGDLTEMTPDEGVDVLVVSAFPNDYTPTPHSLIGRLAQKGISVAQLAQDKAEDFRPNLSCWISKELPSSSGIGFKRILCFEPLTRGNPADTVSDIFQCLIASAANEATEFCVAMPVVATGDQNAPLAEIIEPLLDAAIHWMELGLALKDLKIVTRNELRAAELKGAFSVLKRQLQRERAGEQSRKYDLFISYSHANKDEADFLKQVLEQARPNVRIFLDRSELKTGVAWQQEIYEAIDQCQRVIAIFSPPYMQSKMCREEFNIAMLRHRESKDGVLLPLYLQTASLPSYMRLIQYQDCRELDRNKLQAACETILSVI